MDLNIESDAERIGDGQEDKYYPAPIPFPLLVLMEAALAPLAYFVGFLSGEHPLGRFAWTWEGARDGLLTTVPMLAVLALALRWPIGPLRQIKEFIDNELRPALAEAGWADLALLAVAAGLGEELLFRGVIQGVTIHWAGPVVGILAASVLFGMLHPVSLAYLVFAAMLGGYLGAVLYLNGNLLTVVVAHAVYDFIALVVLLRRSAARWNPPGEPDGT